METKITNYYKLCLYFIHIEQDLTINMIRKEKVTCNKHACCINNPIEAMQCNCERADIWYWKYIINDVNLRISSLYADNKHIFQLFSFLRSFVIFLTLSIFICCQEIFQPQVSLSQNLK